MAYKSAVQDFSKYWSNMRDWAAENNVPRSALVPVFNYDLDRLKKGYPMSEAERYRAVLAAAGKNATVLPTTVNRPSAIVTNVRRTLWDIFTGLNPVGLVTNFVDSVKNTIENPMLSIKALAGTQTALHTITTHPTKSALAEFIPGALDVAKIAEGRAGITTLVSHPLYTLIDALPVGEVAGAGLKAAGLDIGAIAAARGATDVEGESIFRNLGKLIGTAKSPSKALSIGKDLEGNPVFARETISQTAQRWMLHSHLGGKASESMYGALTLGQKYTNLSQETLSALDKKMQLLPDDLRNQMITLLQKSGRSAEDLVNTDTLDLRIRDAITQWIPIRNGLLEYGLSTGKIMQIPLPTGEIGIYSSRIGKYMQAGVDRVDKALQAFNDREQEANAVSQKAEQLDSQINPLVQQTKVAQEGIWRYITQTIQHTQGEIRDKLRTAITSDNRWSSNTFGFNTDRIKRLKAVRESPERVEQMKQLGLPVEGGESGTIAYHEIGELTKSHANVLEAVFKPGGLLDRMNAAWKDKDYQSFRDLARQASRYMDRSYAKELHIVSQPQLFSALLGNLKQIYEFSKDRKTTDDEFDNIMQGRTAKGKKVSVTKLFKDYWQAQKDFYKQVERHPPDNYRPIYLDVLTNKILEHDKMPELMSAAKDELAKQGFTDEEINKLNSDPRVLVELLNSISSTVYDNPLVGKILGDVKTEVENSAFRTISTLRAQGFQPEYVPNITPAEMRGEVGMYNIFVGRPTVPTLSHAMDRTFEYGSTVNNFMAAVHHAVRDKLQHIGTKEYIDNYVIPHTYKFSDVQKMLLSNSEFRARLADVTDPDARLAVMQKIVADDMGLVKYDQEGLFGFSTPRLNPGDPDQLYINSDHADVIKSIVTKGQLPMNGLVDKATGLFKFAILGMSPRFTLHIAVGGTYLLALKTNPLIFRFLPEAYKMVKSGTVPDEILHSVTQEGNEYVAYHYMGGRTMARWSMEQWMGKYGIDPRTAAVADWVNAAANLNFKFTRFVANMQRALAFFDGVSKVGKLEFVKDEEGKLYLNTTDRSMYEGLKSVRRVMGDLRQMSPFERNVMTRLMPFYGWTKHILKYVLSMPVDHPFRAQILGDMAEANSGNITPLLPTRIQLLFFLGKPTEFGTVTAITDRYADPLRTTANYASMAGWISGLNPLALGPLQYIDPQITYGTNSLYPTTTYTHAFGVNVGQPGGSPLTPFEAVVPQLQTLTIALGLSSQYRNLAKTTPAAFKKDLFESFNIPFANIQHINLKQIAAKNEIDKYEVASKAATTAFTSGTFKQLEGYSTVPYPLNPIYNVSPGQLEELYQQSMQEYGLPPEDIEKYVRSPSLL